MKVFYQPQFPTSVKVNVNKRDVESVGTAPVDNILKMYARATADEHNAANWYHDAHNHAVELAKISGLSVEQTSGVIAVISPKQKWHVNVDMAYRGIYAWLSGERIQLSPFNKVFTDRAYDLMDGKDVTNVGQKVHTFWQTILSPDTCQLPTIDSVATSIAFGSMSYFPGTYSLGRGKGDAPSPQYALLQDAYRQAAVKVGIPATAMQAITWTACRRIKKENRNLTGETLHRHFMQYCGGENTEAHGFVQHLVQKGITL